MYLKSTLALDRSKSARLKKEFKKNLTVYWNKEFENWIVHYNGVYLFEFEKGKPFYTSKVKQHLYYVHNHHAMRQMAVDNDAFFGEKDRVQKAEMDDMKHDFKVNAKKFGSRQRKSVL